MELTPISEKVKVAVTIMKTFSGVMAVTTGSPMGPHRQARSLCSIDAPACPNQDEVKVDQTSSPTQAVEVNMRLVY